MSGRKSGGPRKTCQFQMDTVNRGETGGSLNDHRYQQEDNVAVGGIGNLARRGPSTVSEIRQIGTSNIE